MLYAFSACACGPKNAVAFGRNKKKAMTKNTTKPGIMAAFMGDVAIPMTNPTRLQIT